MSKKSELNTKLIVWGKEKIVIRQEKVIERLSFKTIWANVANAFNLEKGLLNLIWKLSYKPGPTIKLYLDTGRYDLFSPIKYFLLIVGLTIFIAALTDYDVRNEMLKSTIEELNLLTKEELAEISNDKITTKTKNKFLNNTSSTEFQLYTARIHQKLELKYRNFFSIFVIILISLLSRILFLKSNFNLAEHLVINTYIFTHIAIIHLLQTLFKSTHILFPIIEFAGSIIMSLMTYKYLFGKNWIKTILCTLTIYAVYQFIIDRILHYSVIYYINNIG